ncbi:uncharacterized protein BO97DRAFT_481874 [Aspergillus homomorphus CBS 101889]|uniref:Myb-like domain-containing protein n=1 Tax=Aspergillus homomorphus (strain CBS 101889) TaxID=1450537 RepID=A0A395HH56_ASPHC|nr:hypothetical protein BO97DRAFT_481874 [Aspergillus homomorphus CBS 101889]RAL06485.1 hypothetical protein BO97DRAFT_481874 [Aspergillus homomorphus CBS 101889]
MGAKWNRSELEKLRSWVAEHDKKGTKWSEREKRWKKEQGTPRSAAAIRAQFLRLSHGWIPKCMIDQAQSSESCDQAPTPPSPQFRHRWWQLRRKCASYPTRLPRKQRRYRVNLFGSVIKSFRSTARRSSSPPVSTLSRHSTTPRVEHSTSLPVQHPVEGTPRSLEKVLPPCDDVSRLQSCLEFSSDVAYRLHNTSMKEIAAAIRGEPTTGATLMPGL